MDFSLTREQEDLRQKVRSFAESEIKPIICELDEKEEFSTHIPRKMAEMGLFGITIPREYGGQGQDFLNFVIAVEELARVDSSYAATMCVQNTLALGPLFRFGTEAQKRKYLPLLCQGDKLWAFALTERDAGSDASNCKTKAELNGDRWTINGEKIYITNADTPITFGATVMAVTSRDEKGDPRFSCFLVEKKTKGFHTKTMRQKLMWRAINTAEILFEDCSVEKDCLLGEEGQGSKMMLESLNSGRVGIAALALGLAQGAYEMALNYAKERKAFGKPIGKFQANSFKLADCAMEIEAARALVYKVAWMRQQNLPIMKEAAMAKLFASEVAKKVTEEAMQIHGGRGLFKEYHIERFWRDQRLLHIGEGTSEIQRLVISRAIGL